LRSLSAKADIRATVANWLLVTRSDISTGPFAVLHNAASSTSARRIVDKKKVAA
jgi:hypothetical protein